MNFMKDIYVLKHIKRYSTVPTIMAESVAEHGYFVAAIVVHLHHEYSFVLEDALLMAIAHDMPEIELNDCPHVIKHKYPEIKEAFDICEERVAQELPTELKWGVEQFNAGTSVEAKIVQLADVIQCIQFTENEVKLGNKGYMLEVLVKSRQRASVLRKELQDEKR